MQQHSVIMTDSDRTIRVLCSFEVSDQTITLGTVEQGNIPLPPNGIDVSYVLTASLLLLLLLLACIHLLTTNTLVLTCSLPPSPSFSANLHGRSQSDRKMGATLVANTAAPPSIVMRILDATGHDAQVVSLGDDLTLRIELKDQKGSAFAMFARNLYARSSNGESLFLIDNNGCPVDSSVFPQLQLDPADNRSLYSRFKAFRFPSTGVVNFEVQIRFCQEFCEPIKCNQASGHVSSFGRRRRRRSVNDFQEVYHDFNGTLGNTSSNGEAASEDANLSAVKSNFTILNISMSHSLLAEQTNDLPVVSALTATAAEAVNSSLATESIAGEMAVLEDDSNSKDAGKKHNLTKYIRTPSKKTGFAYPSTNYRYYSNRDGNGNVVDNLKADNHDEINSNLDVPSEESPANSENGSDKEKLPEKIGTIGSNGNLFDSDLSTTEQPPGTFIWGELPTSKKAEEKAPEESGPSFWSSESAGAPLLSDHQPKHHQHQHHHHHQHHHGRHQHQQQQPHFHLNQIVSSPEVPLSPLYGEQRTEMERKKEEKEESGHWNTVSSAILPLPAVATEVPLSLAIMVDDQVGDTGGEGGDLASPHEFDEPAAATFEHAGADNLPSPLNEHRLNLNYADVAKLETRNDLHFGKGKCTAPL